MDSSDLLTDAYGRIRSLVHRAADGLDPDGLAHRPEPEANSIAWLLWHLTRIQDDHVSELSGRPQVWLAEGWSERFGLPFAPDDTGYGHTSEQVAAVRPTGPDPLIGYHDAVAAATIAYFGRLDAAELDRIIDESYDPPVSVGVRLVSVLSDNLQHAGQAVYLRGIIDRMPRPR